MPKFIIERNLPGAGALNQTQLQNIAKSTCKVLWDLGPEIQWVHSYVADDRLYCIYIAPSEDLIRQHAKEGNFPCDNISRVHTIIEPVTAE